jgi:hypothetical protein
MKLLTLVFVLPILAFAQDETEIQDRRVQDLRFLAAELTRVHPELKSGDFTQAVAELEAEAPYLQDHQFLVRMAQVVAMAGNPSTWLDLSQPATGFGRYPLRLLSLPEGFFVVETAPTARRALHSRLAAIGAFDLPIVLERLAALFPQQNPVLLRQRLAGYLVIPQVLHALGLIDRLDNFPFDFLDHQAAFFLELNPLTADAATEWLPTPDLREGFVPLHRRNRTRGFWLHRLDTAGALYVKLDRSAPGFSDWLREVAANITLNPADRVVIDLRDCAGADADALQGLGATLRTARSGSLFVILSSQTSTVALSAAASWKRDHGAVLIGDPLVGDPALLAGTRLLVLPHSRLAVHCASAASAGIEAPAIDVRVNPSYGDYFARHDPFLAVALAYRSTRGVQ